MGAFQRAAISVASRIIGKRLFGVGREDDDYFMYTQRYGIDMRSRNKLKTYKGLVYAMVNLVSETAAGSYRPHIYRWKGDQREDIGKHPLLDLLRHPGGYTSANSKAVPVTQFDLIEATIAFLRLQGEVYWYVGKGVMTGRPREIVILRADRVGIDIDDQGDIQGYFIRRNSGNPIPLAVDEVVPIKLFNPKDPYHGYSNVEAADEFILTDELTNKFTSNFFNNNAGINGVLALQGEVEKGAFKKFVRAWRAKYEGVDNAGKTAIIRGTEAAFTKIGLGLDELDMSSLRKMSREDLSMMFRVPLPLLGLGMEGTGMGRGNIEALEYIFAKYGVTPMLKRIDGTLEFMLQRYYDSAEDLEVEHRSIIPEDTAAKLNERDKGVDRWKTRNEIRDEDGLDPISGGDELYMPITSIPLGTDMSEPSATENKNVRRIVLRTQKKKPVAGK